MTTIDNINAVVSEIDRLSRVLADDVISLRTDLNSGQKEAKAQIDAKLNVAKKLAETRKMLQDLGAQSDRFDIEVLGLK